MKYKTSILPVLFIFVSACAPTGSVKPTAEILHTETTSPASDISIQTELSEDEFFEVTDFQVSIGEVTCALTRIPIEGDYYLSECDQELILPINQAVTVTLIPPDKAEYILSELFEQMELVEILFHDAHIAYFRDGNIPNQTDFVIPFSNTSGEDVICAFSFQLDREVMVLIKGTAQR